MALRKVRPVIVEDVCQAFVDETVPAVSQPVEVALVKVSPVLLAKVNIPVPTWKLPEPVALVNVMPVDETVPKMPAFVTESEAACRLPELVALVNVNPCKPVTPVTFKVPETFALPVVLRVASCRFPEPVAFVKVRPVEDVMANTGYVVTPIVDDPPPLLTCMFVPEAFITQVEVVR